MEPKAVSDGEGTMQYQSEIDGGKKRYTHQTYGLGVTYKADRTKVRFHKKPWVPQWLWNLLGTPDPYDMLESAMNRAGCSIGTANC